MNDSCFGSVTHFSTPLVRGGPGGGLWNHPLTCWGPVRDKRVAVPGLSRSSVSSEKERDRGLQGLSAFICNCHEILYLALNFFQRSHEMQAL